MQTLSHTVVALALALTVAAVSPASAREVWKWVDKNGVVHYSDQPVPGAQRVDISIQTYESEQATIPSTSRPTPRPGEPITYDAVTITEPANEQTFVNVEGAINVSVTVEPELRSGHSIRFEIDGRTVSPPESAASTLELKDVPRGEHTVRASIIDRTGKVLAQSQPVTFFVQQASVLNRPR